MARKSSRDPASTERVQLHQPGKQDESERTIGPRAHTLNTHIYKHTIVMQSSKCYVGMYVLNEETLATYTRQLFY